MDKQDCEQPDCDGRISKVPVNPSTGYNASSTDSDTWGAFDEALRYHRDDGNHSHGVGYMFASEGTVVGLDLDNVRDPETGDLEAWAQNLVDRLESFTEVSASGTGLHIYVLGIKPGDNCRRGQESTLERFDKAELEIYDESRYFAVTGDRLEDTPQTLEQRNSTLAEVYEEFLTDDVDEEQDTIDDTASSEPTPTADLDDSTLVEKAKSAGNGQKFNSLWNGRTTGYESQSEADLALCSLLAFWTGGEEKQMDRLFRESGLMREKWDEDRGSQTYGERTIEKALEGRTEFYEPGEGKSPEPDINNAEIALEEHLPKYENDPEREMEHAPQIWKAVGDLGPDRVDEYADRVAEVLDVDQWQVKNHAKYSAIEAEQGRIVVEGGRTWYLAGTPRRRYELLNFELSVESYLQVERGPLRAQVHADLAEGGEFTKPIEPKIFNKKERFDDELLSESFATKFNVPSLPGGNSPYTQDLLDALRLWIHHQDAPTRRGVRHMGAYGDEFAIPNHTLTPDGWTDTPDTVYLEREIGAERRVSLPTDRDQADEEAVAKILETLPYTRETDRFLPVLGWFYAAPFRPVIDGLSEDGEFNHLNITGDTGSGKTASLSYLWRCFGMSGEPFSVDSSAFAQLATFSSTRSIPLWFDEYKPSDIQGYKLDRFHDKLRKANRGAFAERGNADKTTDSYKIQAPCVVSGEQTIQGPAERRRSIMTQFKTSTTDPDAPTAKRFKELVGMARMDDGELQIADEAPSPGDHALAYYKHVTGTDTESVREAWHDALEEAHAVLADLGVVEELDDLELQGLQTVVFGMKMYRQFAEGVGADAAALPDDEDVRAGLEHVVDRIGPEGKRKSHTDRFVELFARATAAEYVERGTHYELVREGQPGEELRVNLPRTYDAMSKYARDHDIRSEDLLNDAKDYRDRFRELVEQSDSYVKKVDQYTPGVSDCTGISTLVAMDALEFDRSVITDEPMGDPASSGTSDDGDGGDGAADDTATEHPDSGQPAAADGGEDIVDATGKVREYVKLEVDHNEKVSQAAVAGSTGLQPGAVQQALKNLREDGTLQKGPDGELMKT
jgi:primase-polymerase (primpol)-like protein